MTTAAPSFSPILLTIFGQPCSKSNRSQIVTIGSRPSIGKSPEAKIYIRDSLRQIPPAARQRLEGPLKLTIWMFYQSERADMDESQLLDIMQDQWKRPKPVNGVTQPRQLVQAGVYRNDSQVRERHVYHAVDAKNPRVIVQIEPRIGLQPPLFDLPVARAVVQRTRDSFDCAF